MIRLTEFTFVLSAQRRDDEAKSAIMNKIVWVILGPKNVYLFFLRTLV
jgi:hypothetical protein